MSIPMYDIDDDYERYIQFCGTMGVEPWDFEEDFYLHWKQLELGY